MNTIKEYYIYIVIVLFVVGVFSYQYVKIQNLKADNAMLRADIEVHKINEFTLKNTIITQNDEVEKHRVDLEQKIKQYQDLLNKPEKERFKVIYQTIPNIGAKSDECEDIKKLIDDIRSSGY